MISTFRYWILVLAVKLLRIGWVFQTWKFTFTVWMTALTIIRYWKGIRERRKMVMTWEQASERSHRYEIHRIDEMLARERNEMYLRQRQIEKNGMGL